MERAILCITLKERKTNKSIRTQINRNYGRYIDNTYEEQAEMGRR